MNKLYSLGLAFLLAFIATGCQLYFGEERNDGDAYCAADGYYVRGEWVSAQCPGGGNACATNEDCAAGCICDEEKGRCEETGFCSKDSDCPANYECDARSSCVPIDGGSCAAAVDPQTCTAAPPRCPQGSVPMVKNGCWYDGDDNGQPDCEKISECAEAPSCEARQHEADCSASSCNIIKRGEDCAMPGGGACQDGVPGCVCARYVFQECGPRI